MLRTEASSIGTGTVNNNPKRTLLPAIPSTYQQEPIEFSSEDISKIIEQLVTKGPKYTQIKKSMTQQQANSLPLRLQASSFVKVMVRKIVIKMGEERRLGNGLRGFSRLLLEEIESECWPLIGIERSLWELERKEQAQMAVLKGMFNACAASKQ